MSTCLATVIAHWGKRTHGQRATAWQAGALDALPQTTHADSQCERHAHRHPTSTLTPSEGQETDSTRHQRTRTTKRTQSHRTKRAVWPSAMMMSCGRSTSVTSRATSTTTCLSQSSLNANPSSLMSGAYCCARTRKIVRRTRRSSSPPARRDLLPIAYTRPRIALVPHAQRDKAATPQGESRAWHTRHARRMSSRPDVEGCGMGSTRQARLRSTVQCRERRQGWRHRRELFLAT